MKQPVTRKIVIGLSAFFIISGCTSILRTGKTHRDAEYLSPLAVVSDITGRTLYIAEFTGKKIAVFDTETGTVKKNIPVPDSPSGLVLSPDGSHLYVTCASPSGTVQIIDVNKEKITGNIQVGHTPCSPVISPDGKKLYVCNRFDNNISIIDIGRSSEIGKFSVLKEPIAADITPDGKYLFIANHLPTGTNMYDYVTDGGVFMIGSYISSGYFSGTRESYASACVILVLDTRLNKLVELIALPNGSTGAKGVCVSPDGGHVYITHVLGHYNLPTTQLDRGWINSNALSVIDIVQRTDIDASIKLVNTVLLDDIDQGAANPWGVTCSPHGEYILVSHSGSHEISIIDGPGLLERLNKLKNNEFVQGSSSPSSENVQHDLAYLAGLRRRIKLHGKSPRDITVIGTKIYTTEYFTDTLGVIDGFTSEKPVVRSVALGPDKPQTLARKGEMYFNDGDLSFQSWQSCASCHPDGRSDGLNWDLLNDGIGNPKKTRSLLLSHLTPPVMITGVRAKAEDAVRAGLRFIHFSVLPEDVASAIDIYLKTLKPVPSPYLVKGKLSKEAKRGEKIFVESGCVDCHPEPLYTNLRKYDVGTGVGREENCEFDTPTLLEVWRTAPYLYDGRTDLIYDILKKYNGRNKHGVTSKLINWDSNDLIEYILSL